eukprot:gb/GFBE01030603.1/.p1 GENE.gb/GFBE01030603.1/~~gb/GFBE01030603.1/.p1  ORF type:complete len:343 (+),score=106.28 gb/GFBE01030603.1/:1-1029(+)
MAERVDRMPVSKEDDTVKKSKMLSWLLRHGAKHKAVGINMDANGWISLKEVNESSYLKNLSRDDLMKVIIDSNASKTRYQLTADCNFIRAYSYQEKKSLSKNEVVPEKSKPSKEAPAAAATAAAAAAAAAPVVSSSGMRADAAEFIPPAPGSAQAAPLVPLAPMPGYPYPMPFHPMMPPFFPPYVPVQVVDRNHTGPANREIGVIKSFNDEKGFGFISCERVKQQFGCDTFLHKAQLNGFSEGDEVSFLVTKNDKNQPQAKSLQPAKGGPAPGKGKAKGEKGKDGKGKDGKGKDGKGKGKGKSEGASEGKGEKGKGKGKEGGKKGKGKGKKEKSGDDDEAEE